jgi:hypothetical protein
VLYCTIRMCAKESHIDSIPKVLNGIVGLEQARIITFEHSHPATCMNSQPMKK